MSKPVGLVSVKCRGVGTYEPPPEQKALYERIALMLPAMPDHKALAEFFGTTEEVVGHAISYVLGKRER